MHWDEGEEKKMKTFFHFYFFSISFNELGTTFLCQDFMIQHAMNDKNHVLFSN